MSYLEKRGDEVESGEGVESGKSESGERESGEEEKACAEEVNGY